MILNKNIYGVKLSTESVVSIVQTVDLPTPAWRSWRFRHLAAQKIDRWDLSALSDPEKHVGITLVTRFHMVLYGFMLQVPQSKQQGHHIYIVRFSWSHLELKFLGHLGTFMLWGYSRRNFSPQLDFTCMFVHFWDASEKSYWFDDWKTQNLSASVLFQVFQPDNDFGSPSNVPPS